MRFRAAVGTALVMAMAASSTGCATSYVPRPSSHVQMIMKGGTPAYVRDGKVYEGGLFGGELDQAVQGNPEAESHARAFQNGTLGGFLTAIAGSVSMGAGLGFVAVNAGRLSDERSSSTQALGASLLIGGLAAYIAGFALIANAAPHQFDAINVYNDGIYEGPAPGPYALPPRPMPPPSPGASPQAPGALPQGPGAPLPRAP